MRAILLTLFILIAYPARADDARDARNIVGIWRLASVVYEDEATKERTPVLGEKPKGRQIVTPEGHWLALVTGEGRSVPRTDEERAKALRTMISYTGRYTVKDGKVTTKVEAAWNEAWVGGEQVRFIRFDGDKLFIESPSMPLPNHPRQGWCAVIVIWERDK